MKKQTPKNTQEKQKYNNLAIIGFIISFLGPLSIIGAILCIIALIQLNKQKQKGFGLAIAGIIIGLVIPIILMTIFLGAGLFVLFKTDAIKGSGNVILKSYDLSDFDSIKIRGGENLFVTQGEEYSVRIEAEDNILSLLRVEVETDELNIGPEGFIFFRNTKPINAYVTIPEITALSIGGSGTIQGENIIKSEELNLVIEGSGDIDVEADVDELTTKIFGSGEIDVDGRTRTHEASITGSGDINTFELISEDTNVLVSGSGNVKVYSSNTLNIIVSGSGYVLYKGNPEITQKISGSGEVKKVD